MRRPLAFLLLALLAAAPAAAQEKHGRMRVIPPSPLSALRGAAAPATPISTPPQPLTPQAGDPGQCRIACARSYYFCLAGDDAETCAPSWGQCRGACTAPSFSPPLASMVR
ncbi:hypothetical protein [Phenylobacterium sp.]|jgi:hypothetical protein|uniref:hypothetical protein n=1 Tax=Phenylobacterium sp. TaxID=1871053 RepID=UPI002F41CAAF